MSGEEQKTKGYSLPDQRAEQLEYCARENLEIVKEFEDAGYSGKFLERPDLDELRDLVAAGGVNVVVVSKRDRLARGLYAGYLNCGWCPWSASPPSPGDTLPNRGGGRSWRWPPRGSL